LNSRNRPAARGQKARPGCRHASGPVNCRRVNCSGAKCRARIRTGKPSRCVRTRPCRHANGMKRRAPHVPWSVLSKLIKAQECREFLYPNARGGVPGSVVVLPVERENTGSGFQQARAGGNGYRVLRRCWRCSPLPAPARLLRSAMRPARRRAGQGYAVAGGGGSGQQACWRRSSAPSSASPAGVARAERGLSRDSVAWFAPPQNASKEVPHGVVAGARRKCPVRAKCRIL